MILVKVRSPN